MIYVERLNGSVMWLNPLLIESIESTPDTIVTLTNGHKYVLLDTPEGIVEKSVEYLHRIGIAGAVQGRVDTGQ